MTDHAVTAACINCGATLSGKVATTTSGKRICLRCLRMVAFSIPRPNCEMWSPSGKAIPYTPELAVAWRRHGQCVLCERGRDLAPTMPEQRLQTASADEIDKVVSEVQRQHIASGLSSATRAELEDEAKQAIEQTKRESGRYVTVDFCGPCLERTLKSARPSFEADRLESRSKMERFLRQYFDAEWSSAETHPWSLRWNSDTNEWSGESPARRRQHMRAIWEDGKTVRAIFTWLAGIMIGSLAYGVSLGLVERIIAWLFRSPVSEWHWLVRTPFYLAFVVFVLVPVLLIWEFMKAELDRKWRDRSDEDVAAGAAAANANKNRRIIVTAVVLIGAGLLLARPVMAILNWASTPEAPLAFGTRKAVLGNGYVLQLENKAKQRVAVNVAIVKKADGIWSAFDILAKLAGVREVASTGPFELPPGATSELGAMQGIVMGADDAAIVFAKGYRGTLVVSDQESGSGK